ncbi:MAG: transporter ATP-binding protein [Actinomycetia bacterium]|nr:transporter ATP-binding protein [Actinomycetes bacterium]
MSAVLQVRGVDKSFDGKVLDGVDVDVHEGEIVVLLGRSGSGKTTLLTIVTDFDRPDAGTVEHVHGTGWRELAVLPQSLGLLPELTVAENVAMPLRLDRADEDVRPLLERLGLAHLAGRYPSETSLGEQQRTALARAVVVRPTLLVADEPVSHQNRAWAEAMMALVRERADDGTACLLATHDEVAIGAADRVLELHDGRLRAH